MLGKRIALMVVIVAAAAIVLAKTASRGTSSAPVPIVRAVAVTESRPAVVLVADVREADSDCGCGQIIRRVRAAKAKGVAVEEVAPDNAEAARRYGVTVVPTVVLLDAKGDVLARREGESIATLAALSADLAKLEAAR